jgi:uncharacterized protein YjbK
MSDPGPSRYELKVTVFPDEEPVVRAAIEDQHAEMSQREVYFYDTPELALKAGKLFLRARTTEGDDPDSTVKLRPLAGAFPPAWQGNGDVRHEVDVIGEREVPSLKLDREHGKIDAGDVGGHDAKRLFDAAQEGLVPVDWDDIVAFGPIHAHLWELEYAELPEKLAVEEWTVSGGPHFVELSFKVKPGELAAAKQAFHALLDELKIDRKGRPAKTEIVLDHFAAKHDQ